MNLFEFNPIAGQPVDVAPPKIVRVTCPYCKGNKGVPNGDGYQCCTQCMAKGYIVTEAQS